MSSPAPAWVSRGRSNAGETVIRKTVDFVEAREGDTTVRDLAIRFGLSLPAATMRLTTAAQKGRIKDLGGGKYGPLPTATPSPTT